MRAWSALTWFEWGRGESTPQTRTRTCDIRWTIGPVQERRERTHDFDTTQTRRSALGSSDYCVVGVYEEEEEGRMFVQGALTVDQRVDAEWWQVSDSRLGSYELRGSFYFFRSITIGFCPATHRAHKVRSRNPRSSLRIDSSGISFRSFLPPITPPVRR